MSDADAREVIARIVYGIEQHGFSVEAGVPWVDSETLESIAAEISASDMADSDFNPYWREADAILAALANAGYAVVRKSSVEDVLAPDFERHIPALEWLTDHDIDVLEDDAISDDAIIFKSGNRLYRWAGLSKPDPE